MERYYRAEGLCPLYEIFSPAEERRMAYYFAAACAFVGGVAVAIGAYL